MSVSTLPDPIAAHFPADTKGPYDVARCCTLDVVVKDKRPTHTIREEITA